MSSLWSSHLEKLKSISSITPSSKNSKIYKSNIRNCNIKILITKIKFQTRKSLLTLNSHKLLSCTIRLLIILTTIIKILLIRIIIIIIRIILIRIIIRILKILIIKIMIIIRILMMIIIKKIKITIRIFMI